LLSMRPRGGSGDRVKFDSVHAHAQGADLERVQAQSQISDLMTAAFKEPIVASKMIGFRFTVGGGKKVRQKYGDDMPKYCRCAASTLPRCARQTKNDDYVATEFDPLLRSMSAGRHCVPSALKKTGARARSWSARGPSSTSMTLIKISSSFTYVAARLQSGTRTGGRINDRRVDDANGSSTDRYAHTPNDKHHLPPPGPQVFPKIDTAAAAAAAAAGEEEEEAEIKVGGMSLDELPPEHLCAIVSRETFTKLYSKQCQSFSQRR